LLARRDLIRAEGLPTQRATAPPSPGWAWSGRPG